MKNRTELAKYFHKRGFKYGAEIGACFGYYSEVLCKNIPGVKLLSIDNWSNTANKYRERTTGKSGIEVTREKLAPYNAVVIKKNSLDAAKDVPDESLDFVFIDADHRYDYVLADIAAWTPKVRIGGIVSGHDYYVFPSGNRGVIDAVDDFVKANEYELNLTEWDKSNPIRDDRVPCWYFFK